MVGSKVKVERRKGCILYPLRWCCLQCGLSFLQTVELADLGYCGPDILPRAPHGVGTSAFPPGTRSQLPSLAQPPFRCEPS